MKAYQSLVRLMEEAKECRRLFEVAGCDLPDPLKRFFGETPPDQSGRGRVLETSIPPPCSPPKPQAAEDDWLWIPASDLSVQLLVLAILRASEGPIPTRELIDRARKIVPSVNSGSIANIGTRLDGHVLSRGDAGWVLTDKSVAPILHQGYAWAQKSVFTKSEVAAHRRMAVKHLLAASLSESLGFKHLSPRICLRLISR